jgi:hypothetical protein
MYLRPLILGLVLVCLHLIALTTTRSSAQIIDLNSNGMSDVWELSFDSYGLNPAVDSDGDGVLNDREAVAGTDPRSSGSLPRLLVARTPTNVSMSMSAAPGKRHQLQSATSPSPVTWTNVSSVLPAPGQPVSFIVPLTQSPRFFRVSISDVDSDGDGVNDWEEYQLGLNPFQAESSGQLDGNGQPLTDRAYAIGRFADQNVVSIRATDPAAVQPDVGQAATSLGTYTVSRSGFPLNTITVNLGLAGPGSGIAVEGVDHETLTRPILLPAGTSSADITLVPLANTNRIAAVLATLRELPGTGYTVGIASNASVVIYPSPTPSGIGLTGQYFTNASTTYSNSLNFNPSNLRLTRVDPGIDNTNAFPFPAGSRFTVRWTGEVQPQYSEDYFFEIRSDDGVRLWVNDQLLIDAWGSQGYTTRTNALALQGGVKYRIQLDYLAYSGTPRVHLYWYSESQPRQFIPANRLYPLGTSASSVTSPLTAVAFLGQPFSFVVTGANAPQGYTASGLPPGLSFNSTNGTLGGVPTLAGRFQVSITASNSAGTGASIIDLTVFETGSAVTREIWTGIPGNSITNIPLSTTPNLTSAHGSLQGVTDYGDNYGERIRGYITVPASGHYYFWLAASHSAELWISNDSEPGNKVRRAFVLPNGTAPLQWNLQPGQQSPWLSLVAGQRYYIEILHKAGTGAGDHWAVAWRLDPSGTNNTPASIVPSHVLSRHFDQPPAFIPGTLYGANMLAQSGALSSGVGSATLRVSADESQAILKCSYGGLSSPYTASHIHSDQYLTHPSQIIFDIDAATPRSDGSYVWDIVPVGTLTAAEIREIIRTGRSYINIHTVNYPAGEINGHFILAVGSQNFSPPPPPPAWTDDHASAGAAARFLIQSTFGPNAAEIASVQSLGYEGWINDQFSLPVSRHLTNVLAKPNADPSGSPYPASLVFNTWWQQAVIAPDQLRQRVAFALSEILVVSENGVLDENGRALSSYYDTLLEHAFGNFRELLEAVTLSPAMGLYLDMRRNEKGSIITGTHPNENYAREILQLFSVGLNRMWPDGTLVMSSEGNLVPTYGQEEILGFSRVFTGWNYYQTNQANGRLPTSWSPSANYTNPMVLVPARHEPGTKRLLDNVMLPPAQGAQADPADPAYDAYGLEDLERAHDSIFYNENVGPFICRQLIQRLVTSHPNRDYLYRVVQKFNDNGSGVRGDMKAVLKAILLDHEARSGAALSQPTFGKQREPLCRVTAVARAFPPPAPLLGTYNQASDRTISVTTTSPHRLNNNDTVVVSFTDTSGKPEPSSQSYGVSVTSRTNFTVNATGISLATYGQAGTTLSVTNSGHDLSVGFPVYLSFVTGDAPSALYTVVTVPSSSTFTVTAANPATRVGSCVFPKLTGGGLVQAGTDVTFSLGNAHGLAVGDNVYVDFAAGAPSPDGQYQVAAVLDSTRFKVSSTVSNNATGNGMVIFPMVPPPLFRSGNARLGFNTWNMNRTDTGTSSSLSQTPLNSPTVFNFFFPDYKFPGVLASAGLTTPEFQLTSDTEVILQMNFLTGGLLNNTGNTNGLSSFNGGNGSIVVDLGPWMTPAYTSNAGIPGLVDSLNTLLCGGQLSASVRTGIVNYATSLPYTTPSATQMRDRVRAVVHLIVNSPDYTIQK